MDDYVHDFPDNAPLDKQEVKLQLNNLTLRYPTFLSIFCTRPFRLLYTHPSDANRYHIYPVDPLPMGVPIIIRDMGWTEIVVRPLLFPAQLRIYSQVNNHEDPPPGVLE